MSALVSPEAPTTSFVNICEEIISKGELPKNVTVEKFQGLAHHWKPAEDDERSLVLVLCACVLVLYFQGTSSVKKNWQKIHDYFNDFRITKHSSMNSESISQEHQSISNRIKMMTFITKLKSDLRDNTKQGIQSYRQSTQNLLENSQDHQEDPSLKQFVLPEEVDETTLGQHLKSQESQLNQFLGEFKADLIKFFQQFYNNMNIFHTSSECEYTASPSESASIKKRIAIAAGEPSKRSKRKKPISWTGKEDDALVKGLEKYGFGKWAKIYNEFKETFDENGRGHVSLKDRARTLMKSKLIVSCV
eukprot:scaffold29871_cov40-Cyclotella_meneghiniana.AAC.3